MLTFKLNPTLSSCDMLKDEKELLSQLRYQTCAFPAPKLVSGMQRSGLCLKMSPLSWYIITLGNTGGFKKKKKK